MTDWQVSDCPFCCNFFSPSLKYMFYAITSTCKIIWKSVNNSLKIHWRSYKIFLTKHLHFYSAQRYTLANSRTYTTLYFAYKMSSINIKGNKSLDSKRRCSYKAIWLSWIDSKVNVDIIWSMFAFTLKQKPFVLVSFFYWTLIK